MASFEYPFRVFEAIADASAYAQQDLPKSRELSLGLTKLDEARMWLQEAAAIHARDMATKKAGE